MGIRMNEFITLKAGSMLFAFDGLILYIRILTPGGIQDSKPWDSSKGMKEYYKLRQRRRRMDARLLRSGANA